jgi:hypothetical protein
MAIATAMVGNGNGNGNRNGNGMGASGNGAGASGNGVGMAWVCAWQGREAVPSAHVLPHSLWGGAVRQIREDSFNLGLRWKGF